MTADKGRLIEIISRSAWRQTESITLPSGVFFVPTPRFAEWVSTLSEDTDIVDCGCGMGVLADSFRPRYVISIDINEREGERPGICHIDAALYPFEKGSVAFFGRPCAGDWFDDTVYMALTRGARVFAATAKEKYLGDWKRTVVAENVGEAGETLWELTGD